jgi:hypothetical protein
VRAELGKKLPSFPAVVRKLGPPDEQIWRDIVEEPTAKGIVINSFDYPLQAPVKLFSNDWSGGRQRH